MEIVYDTAQYKYAYDLDIWHKIYSDFINNQIHNVYGLNNNKYNSICPDLDIISANQKFKKVSIGEYYKLYYEQIPLNTITCYNPFYPETFYYIWEIINKYKLIKQNTRKIVYMDDGGDSQIGHLEAIKKYCEENDINDVEHLRAPTINSYNVSKKFNSIYGNYKTVLNKDAIKNKCDLLLYIIERVDDAHNYIRTASNCIIYIHNFLDKNIHAIINKLCGSFVKSFIHFPEIQDPLKLSCYLILIDKNEEDINDTYSTNIVDLCNTYMKNYISNMLNLYESVDFSVYDLMINLSITTEAVEWAKKYNLQLKDINFGSYIWEDYLTRHTAMSFTKNNIQQDIQVDNNPIRINELNKIKLHINKYKRIMDTKEQHVITNCNKDIVDWNHLSNNINMYKNLRKLIIWKFGSEITNNAWIKTYELLTYENLVHNNGKRFQSFHLYENTGGTISALNHYINTQTNIKNFQWYAHCNAYTNDFVGKYDLAKMYPYNWILDGNGNANLKHANTMKHYLNTSHLHNNDLVICDGNNKIPAHKFNEQESLTLFTTYIQIYLTLFILKTGGNCIIKMFLPLAESMTISLLFLLTCLFESVKLIKPLSVNPSSSEIYCVCKKYHGYDSISGVIKNKLDLLYRNFNTNNNIIPMDAINKQFINELVKFSDTFTTNQTNSIYRAICLRDYFHENYELQQNLSDMREKHTYELIDKLNLKSIYKNKLVEDF